RCREGRLDPAAMALSKPCERLRGHARIQRAAFPPPPAPVGRRLADGFGVGVEPRHRRRCGKFGRYVSGFATPESGQPFEHQECGFLALMIRFQPMKVPRDLRDRERSARGTALAFSWRCTIE